jgi:CheY-like chemotaxis protein
MQLSWVESGGPRIKRPDRRGYGMRVVKAGIEGQLGGLVEFDWQPEGLRCTVVVPHDEKSDTINRVLLERRSIETEQASVFVSPTPGDPILLVEDEPLVSMMLAEMLSGFGHIVDGPYNRLSEAVRAAESNDIRAGILDINVGGEKSYAVADVLTTRNIPFIFVTGYSADGIDSRFTHVPVLQKPIEPKKLRAVLLQSSNGVER